MLSSPQLAGDGSSIRQVGGFLIRMLVQSLLGLHCSLPNHFLDKSQTKVRSPGHYPKALILKSLDDLAIQFLAASQGACFPSLIGIT